MTTRIGKIEMSLTPLADSGALRRVDGGGESNAFFVPFNGSVTAVKIPFGSTRFKITSPVGQLLGEWIFPPGCAAFGGSEPQAGTVQNRNLTTSVTEYQQRYLGQNIVAGPALRTGKTNHTQTLPLAITANANQLRKAA